MSLYSFLALICGSFIFSMDTIRADVDFSTNYAGELSLGYRSKGLDRTRARSVFEGSIHLEEKADFMDPKPQFFIEGSTRLDLEAGKSGSIYEEESIRQLGMTMGRKPQFSLFLGRKVVFWGKTDEFSPIDQINSENYREFLSLERARRKIPRQLLQFKSKINAFHIEFIVTKDHVSHRMPDYPSLYCLGECKKFSIDSVAEQFSQNGFISSIDSKKNRMPNIHELAAKIEWKSESIDIALYSFRMAPKYPSYSRTFSSDTNIEWSRETPLTNQYGLGFSTTVGSFGFRGEGIFRENQLYAMAPDTPGYALDADGLSSNSEWESVIGIDRTIGDTFYFNLQVGAKEIQGYTDELILPNGNRLVTLLLKDSFFTETLLADFRILWEPTRRSYLLEPKIKYWIADDLALTGAASFYQGKEESLLGPFKKTTHLRTNLTFIF